jgi:tetratricopeptide (TPR) repeat protein
LSEIAIFYYRAGKLKDFLDIKRQLEKEYSTDKNFYEFLIKSAQMDDRLLEIPQLVEKLLEIEPGSLEYMMIAGQSLFESGKLVEAATWFKRVRDKLPTYPKVLYFIAKIDFLSGDVEGAVKKIEENIKTNGESVDDLVFLAEIQLQKNNISEAEVFFKKAQKINANSFEAVVGLADVSIKMSNLDGALDLYTTAKKLRPEEAIIHKKMGDVYQLLGQGDLAIESYKRYLDMDPESPHKVQIQSYINKMQ